MCDRARRDFFQYQLSIFSLYMYIHDISVRYYLREMNFFKSNCHQRRIMWRIESLIFYNMRNFTLLTITRNNQKSVITICTLHIVHYSHIRFHLLLRNGIWRYLNFLSKWMNYMHNFILYNLIEIKYLSVITVAYILVAWNLKKKR